jgi:hypothetical protein
VPGEGDLPLRSFLDVLPDGITIGIEVPMNGLKESGVGPAERVRMAVEGARRLIA